MSDKIKVTKRKLSDYKLDPANPNKGTPRGASMLETSVGQFGPARSGVVDKDGVMRAGNHTAEQLMAAGIEDVIEVEADGKTWVVVRRPDMDSEMGQRYAIMDNRTGELIAWDSDVLEKLQTGGLDLGQFWNDAEIAKLFDLGDELDVQQLWQGMPEFEQDNLKGFKQIIVHFENEADYTKFQAVIGQNLGEKTKSIWYPAKTPAEMKAIGYDSEA